MSITRGEFKEFEKRMDERHGEIMKALSGLPCSAHQSRLDELNKFQWKANIATGLIFGVLLYFKEEIKYRLGVRG